MNLANEFNPVGYPDHKRNKPTQKQRNEFSETIRKKIKKRDKHKCKVCHNPNAYQIHHIKPRGAGGRGVYQNGMLICDRCHERMHDKNKPYLLLQWQEIFEQRYGKDYFLDEWDNIP